MKKLFIIIVALFGLYATVYSAPWNTTGGGTGDMLSSAFVDSIANNHPIVKADTVEADVFRSKTAHIYDLFKNASYDSVGFPSHSGLQGFEYSSRTYSASPATTPPLGWGSHYFYTLSTAIADSTDSLAIIGSGIGGIDAPTTIDSLIVHAAVSDTDSVTIRVIGYIASSATPIINGLLSGWTDDTEKWRRFAIPFTSDLIMDEPYTICYIVTVKGKNWVKTSIARGK